ncbi:hypothetical protein AA15973_1195 [Komagataeibacter sucrofermentans DSM 15973]|nr:hypothetical protein AA15973_1195 [Komagataeibacter sucrofermentans DSM 15973]
MRALTGFHPLQKPGWFVERGLLRIYDPGYIHINIKHLPKLQTADGQVQKQFLYVAIDRCSRSVHLSFYDAENAVDFFKRRNCIEIMFGRLKDWRRVATRYDRCPTAFFSVIALAATVIF